MHGVFPGSRTLTKDLINDARDGRGGVDYNTVFRSVFFRLIQSRNEFPFSLFSPPLIFWSLVKPPVQCAKIDFKDKDAVKHIYEFCKIPRTTAEKCYRLILVGDYGFYFIYMPNVVLVRDAIRRFASFRIAFISQFIVTVNGMIAAPLQFFADRSFAGAGNAFNQIVSNAHC